MNTPNPVNPFHSFQHTGLKPSIGYRIGSMVLDHLTICILSGFVIGPAFIASIFSVAVKESEAKTGTAFRQYDSLLYSLIVLVGAIYICKDVINGRSIAKRVLPQQILNNTTGEVASPLRTMIRNFFIIIWPVELIIVFFSPARRIGDFVAGTRVQKFNEDATPQPEFRYSRIWLPFGLACVFTGLLVLGLYYRYDAPGQKPKQAHYLESYYNDSASKAMEKIYQDSAGTYATAEVKIYAPSNETNGLKYIKVIFTLTSDMTEPKNRFEDYKDHMLDFLYRQYPPETFKGRCRFQYSAPGRRVTHTFDIGKNGRKKREPF